jgi:hypothetical protein
MKPDQQEIMSQALEALKLLAPGLPVVCIIGFPTESEDTMMVCSGGNMPAANQVLLMSMAMEGMEPPPSGTTSH